MPAVAETDLIAFRRLLSPEVLSALEHWEDTGGAGGDDVARMLFQRWQLVQSDAHDFEAS